MAKRYLPLSDMTYDIGEEEIHMCSTVYLSNLCSYIILKICVFVCTYIHLSKYIYILCDVVANEHDEAIPIFDSD